MNTSTYGYGHTKEASGLVRNELKSRLASEIREYGLNISVKKADSGYGGPRVHITSSNEHFADYYKFIVDEEGSIADSGRMMVIKTTDKSYRWDHRMQLVKSKSIPGVSQFVHEKIAAVLAQFGQDNDDVMTDYFDSTKPLFYGIEYVEGTVAA